MTFVIVTITALHYNAVFKFKSIDADTCESNKDYVVNRVSEDLSKLQGLRVSYKCEVNK
jgi:hypothetical protein